MKINFHPDKFVLAHHKLDMRKIPAQEWGQMTSYRVLALDLDGTLTTSKKEVTPATRKALTEIQEKGKIVALASM